MRQVRTTDATRGVHRALSEERLGGVGRHWSDKPVHPSHAWREDGHCRGCLMHIAWPGARDSCSLKVEKAPRRARTLDATTRYDGESVSPSDTSG